MSVELFVAFPHALIRRNANLAPLASEFAFSPTTQMKSLGQTTQAVVPKQKKTQENIKNVNSSLLLQLTHLDIQDKFANHISSLVTSREDNIHDSNLYVMKQYPWRPRLVTNEIP